MPSAPRLRVTPQGGMRGTQVYLSSEELELLARAAARTGASRSEVIRRAIRQRYGDLELALPTCGPSRERRCLERTRRPLRRAVREQMRGDLAERLQRLGWG